MKAVQTRVWPPADAVGGPGGGRKRPRCQPMAEDSGTTAGTGRGGDRPTFYGC